MCPHPANSRPTTSFLNLQSLTTALVNFGYMQTSVMVRPGRTLCAFGRRMAVDVQLPDLIPDDGKLHRRRSSGRVSSRPAIQTVSG